MKVKIYENKFIPTIGRGPFTEPVEMKESVFRQLKNAGYKIEKCVDKIKLETPSVIIDKKEDETVVETPEEVIEEVTEDPVKETPEETTLEEETVETSEEVEESTEDTLEEVAEDPVEETTPEEETVETSEEVDYDAYSMKDLKKLLDDNGIKYKYNDTKSVIINLVKENNLL